LLLMLRGEISQICSDFVSHPAKRFEALLCRTTHVAGVLETVVYPVDVIWIDGASLPCVIAYRKHDIERLPGKFVHRFRTVPGDVDARFLHHLDRFRPNLQRIRPGALDYKARARIMTEQPLRHLTAPRAPR